MENDKLIEKIANEIAPLVIHKRFCSEFVNKCKEHPNDIPIKIPKAKRILDVIEVLEELYPELKY